MSRSTLSPSKSLTKAQGRDVRFSADDGFELGGTLFEGSGSGPSVLISSATAVPKELYASFAAAVVEAGARAALIYDYRGTGASPAPKDWKPAIRMRDWGLHDMPAAVAALDRLAPGAEMVGVGQSFAGQGLGISGVANRFTRHALVAALSGYFKNLDDRKARWLMRGVGVPVASVSAMTPRWLGVGEPIPGTVFREWAKWCGMRDYFFDDASLPETSRFADVKIRLLSIGLTDDRWGTRRAVEGLMNHYTAAKVEKHWIGTGDVAGQPIGHLGFFRSRFSETLWPPLTRWLLTGERFVIDQATDKAA